MSPEPNARLFRFRRPERTFRDLVGFGQHDGWWAGDVAPERQLHLSTPDLGDEPTEHQLRAETHCARRAEPNRDLPPYPLGPRHLATDGAATRFAVHAARI